jgi:hypothetical protein
LLEQRSRITEAPVELRYVLFVSKRPKSKPKTPSNALGHVRRIVQGEATAGDIEQYRENAALKEARKRRRAELSAKFAARKAGPESSD